jgi:phosphoadenosine phosphosulfate reductase
LAEESRALAAIIQQSSRVQGGFENMAVSFSGGKDSLVALDLAVRVGITKAVYCDTTADFDETVEYVEKVRGFYGIDLVTARGAAEFFDSIDHVGLPTRRARWCCEVHKYGPIARYARERGIKAFVTGLRRNESPRRTLYEERDQNPMIPVPQINPILDWTTEDIWSYIHTYGLPYNPLYDKGLKRVGCWCCPYKSDSEWEEMRAVFPEKVESFERVIETQADKLGIKDKERFVKKRGWVKWISPQRRRVMGELRPCDANDGSAFDVVNIRFHEDAEHNAKKVARLLPVLTDLFTVMPDNSIKVTVGNLDKKKQKINLKILAEKSANCFSCGACTSVCPTGALKVDRLSVYVDEEFCTHCGKCINGGLLRGACIARNYGSKPSALIDLRTESGLEKWATAGIMPVGAQPEGLPVLTTPPAPSPIGPDLQGAGRGGLPLIEVEPSTVAK